MSRDSIQLLVAAHEVRLGLRLLARWLRTAPEHLVAVDLWCDPADIDRVATRLGHLERVHPRLPPHTRVHGVAADQALARVHDRVAQLTLDGPRCVALVPDHGPLPSALRQALVLCGRPGDEERDADLAVRPNLRLRHRVRPEPYAMLCTLTRAPGTLRGELIRLPRHWSYRVCRGPRLVEQVRLTEGPGRALAVLAERGPLEATDLFEAARDPRFGWWTDQGDEHDPERVTDRVRQWISRVRRQGHRLQRPELVGFLPAPRTWALAHPVDVRLAEGLPWRR